MVLSGLFAAAVEEMPGIEQQDVHVVALWCVMLELTRRSEAQQQACLASVLHL